MSLIAFRADASLEIGTGHVIRCLTLAEALRRGGHEVRFVCRALEGHLGERIRDFGFGVDLLPAPERGFRPQGNDPRHAAWAGIGWEEDAGQTAEALAGQAVDWLVVDHYAFDARWQRALAEHVGRIMVWDDLADRDHDCALLLDQNLGRAPKSYAGRVPATARVLAGPSFAPLRPDFARLRPGALAARQGRGLRRIMVSMGGVDAPNATGRILDVLGRADALRDVAVEVILGSRALAIREVQAQAASMPMDVTVAVDVGDMAQRMAAADLAIGAVGGTTWERCALGLPCLMLTIAENQRPAAEAMASTGAAVLLGDLSDPGWSGRLRDWLDAPGMADRLPPMSAAAAAICDGQGASRIVAEMERPRWVFRDAVPADAESVHDWRYGAGPDRFARSSSTPDLESHLAWFGRALDNPSRRIRILEVSGAGCGYIRLDLDATDRATVSLCLAPERRGEGWGALLLQEAQRMALAAGLAALDAEVHVENGASRRLFEAAGYRRAGQDGDFLRYVKDI